MDALLQEFIAETRETLEALSAEILAWEAAPGDGARLDAIFRFVHMVKGSSGFLQLPRLERLSHAAEDALADVRACRRVPDRALVNAVLAVVDRIGALVEALDEGRDPDDADEDRLVAALATGTPEPVPPVAVGPRAPARTVRLGVALLDRMMNDMSDMVLTRNELARVLGERPADPVVAAALARLSDCVAEMRQTVTHLRMQKVETLFAALPRMVRDTAAALGKDVVLTLEGSDVEIDRHMIEAMRDPLVQMVRNAIDHGIEDAEARRAAGKPAAGRLTVAARQAGNQIVLEVCDDGRGIDVPRLVEKRAAARAHKAVPASGVPDVELIFEPGLSVRDAATPISGRGVGMDVVRAGVDRIGGRIELDNRPGSGLRIQIQAPLTLSILPAVLLGVGDQCFALPRQTVAEIVTGPAASVVRTQGGGGSVQLRNRHLPLVALGPLLGIAPAAAEPPVLVVVEDAGGCYVLAVDAVVAHQELVVKPASPPVMAAGIYAGMSLPDTGKPMLLLDSAGLAAAAGLRGGRAADENEAAAAPAFPLPHHQDEEGTASASGEDLIDLDWLLTRLEQASGEGGPGRWH